MPELTVSYVLAELAKNISYGHYGVRIGISLLSIVTPEFSPYEYTVTAWDGTDEEFTDLLKAVEYFVAINKEEWDKCREE